MQELATAALGKKIENFESPNSSALSLKDWDSVTWFVKEGGEVAQKMKSIEDSVLASKPANIETYHFLQQHVTILFRQLRKAYPIPLPLIDLAQLSEWEDEALEKIWGKLSREDPQIFSPNATVKEMKAWFDNPGNQQVALGMKRLCLVGLELKAVPPQLRKFRNVFDLRWGVTKLLSSPSGSVS